MDSCLSTLILSIYVVYMLSFFKTKYNFAHPLTYFENQYFQHPIGVSDKAETKVCRFGRDGSYFLAAVLIIKCLLNKYKLINTDTYTSFSRLVLLVVLILSLMNFNVILYLIPFFIHESRFFFLN